MRFHLFTAVATASSWGVLANAQDYIVIDGDTVRTADLQIIRLQRPDGEPYDTPETFRADCVAEQRLGEITTERLFQLIENGEATSELTGKTCGHDRPCGDLRVDGEDVGDILVAEGLAVPFRRFDWCRPLDD